MIPQESDELSSIAWMTGLKMLMNLFILLQEVELNFPSPLIQDKN